MSEEVDDDKDTAGLDESLWSPKRIFLAIRWWVWFTVHTEGMHKVRLWQLVLNYHRPYAGRRRY